MPLARACVLTSDGTSAAGLAASDTTRERGGLQGFTFAEACRSFRTSSLCSFLHPWMAPMSSSTLRSANPCSDLKGDND